MPNTLFFQDPEEKSKVVAKHEVSCAEEGKVQQEDSFKKALEMIKLLMHASTEVGSDLNLASESTSAETSLVIKEAEKGEEPKEIEEEMELEEMDVEADLNRVVVEMVLQEVVEKGRREWEMHLDGDLDSQVSAGADGAVAATMENINRELGSETLKATFAWIQETIDYTI